MDNNLWLLIFFGVLGLIIGSFMNVCIWRIPRKLSVSKPNRSFCPSCSAKLQWYDLIPVLSWMILGGKCRACRAPISERYPLVEVMSGAAMTMSYLQFGLTPTALVVYILTATLIVITFIDFDFRIIPNVISLPGIVIGLCVGVVSQFTGIFSSPPISASALDSLIGLLAGGGFFLVIGEGYYLLTKREGLGGGDIKLVAMTGAALGWQSVAPTIFVGSFCGAAIGLLTIALKGGDRKLELPFGPWLSLGAVIYIFGDLPFFRF